MKWPDGASYEGKWKNNRVFLNYRINKILIFLIQNLKAHGDGIFRYPDGDVYQG
jgi:hypothetical protein